MILLFACTEPPDAIPVVTDIAWEGDGPYLAPLPAPRLLRRMSLDLLGVFPTEEQLDAVEDDPTAVGRIRDEYLADPRLEERLVSLFAERWNTVLDTYEVRSADYSLPPPMSDAFAHAVGEEPLRLMARVVVEDRPWTEIVTADYTMSNELLGGIWPNDYPEATIGWQPAHYTDGRPAAGVLSTNGMWWRYVTNVSNKSRGRIAAISKLLLCTDILARPVEFKRSTTTEAEDQTRTNPACLACHASIDPAAANLFGFWWLIQYNPYEMQSYHAEREPLGPGLLGVAPGWYGDPTAGLVDLGQEVADDPRFVRCGAESMAEQLWHRDIVLSDYAAIERLRLGFVADGLRPKGLLRAVTDTAEYRAGSFVPDVPEEVVRRNRVERLLTPNQLKTVIDEETGFHWMYQGYDQLENDVLGYRILRGGVDGYSASRVQEDPGLTWTLVNTRVAEGASGQLVIRDLVDGQHTSLAVTLETMPEDPEFSEELQSLHWRWYAERADDAWLAAITELWTQTNAEEGAQAAWRVVLNVMIRDPRFQAY